MRTKSTSKEEARKSKRCYVVDAKGKVLGRLASEVASIVRGKHKPNYTPHVNTGDMVVVINAAEVVLTGNKAVGKIYYRHTGWVGGVRAKTAGELRASDPAEMIRKAVYGMLPKGPLGDEYRGNLRVYAGAEHPHGAQQPQALAI